MTEPPLSTWPGVPSQHRTLVEREEKLLDASQHSCFFRHGDLSEVCDLGEQGSRQLNNTYSCRGVLVSSGCHNKISQTWGLSNSNAYSHSSEARNSRSRSGRVPFLACRWPPSCLVLTWPFLCAQMDSFLFSLQLSPLIRPLIQSQELHPHDLI